MDDLIVSGLRIDWSMLADSYASRIPSLRSLDELGFQRNVTFLAGENGSGKSTLLEHMHRMANGGSQFIIATHSPILLGLPNAGILSFDETGVHPCDYEDTDSYRITRTFIDRRESVLRHLFGDEP